MHDDLTRRKIFWLLQRLTSLSLWKAKYDAFKTFSEAYELAIKTWPPNDPESMEADHLKTIYEILSCYDRGLAELSNGRRFVWRAGQAFKQAMGRFNSLVDNFYRHPKYWEHGSQFEQYPVSVDALYQLLRRSEFQMGYAPLEVWTEDNIANIESPESLLDPAHYDHGFYKLSYPIFPQELPKVPDTTGPVIRSGQKVPYDGIWEPVTVERSVVSGAVPIEVGLFGNDGCFNYLVAGIEAPNLSDFDDHSLDITRRATHWRLLWEDTRYKNGVIPDESQYFLTPAGAPDTVDPMTVGPVRTGDAHPAFLERKFHRPPGRRPDDHPGPSDLGL